MAGHGVKQGERAAGGAGSALWSAARAVTVGTRPCRPPLMIFRGGRRARGCGDASALAEIGGAFGRSAGAADLRTHLSVLLGELDGATADKVEQLLLDAHVFDAMARHVVRVLCASPGSGDGPRRLPIQADCTALVPISTATCCSNLPRPVKSPTYPADDPVLVGSHSCPRIRSLTLGRKSVRG